jgi:hypothetical protein
MGADIWTMASLAKRCPSFVLVAAASVWIAFANARLGDYSVDGAHRVEALLAGDLSAYFAAHSMMGHFASVLQAPFAALGGGDPVAEYQWACVPCLLAAGLVGLYLASVAARRGASPFFQFVIVALCVANPVNFVALWSGHPEEVLTSALVVGAVAVAAAGHGWRAAILLGLALASKQWAVMAILPVLMALPDWGGRWRALLGAGAIAMVFTLPGLVASPEAFSAVHGTAALINGRTVTPMSIWYPVAEVNAHVLSFESTRIVTHLHELPASMVALTHPLIVLLFFVVPLGLVARRRRFGISGPEAMALLGLLALLRCVLDPVDNIYYHAPLLLALVGWDALRPPRALPVLGLLGAFVTAFLWKWVSIIDISGLGAFNAGYLVIVVSAGIAVALWLFAPRLLGRLFGHGLPRLPHTELKTP